ncbi:MAG: ParB N-terminal domain-containing protein, partial [Deltaproteobacteria bacterium]
MKFFLVDVVCITSAKSCEEFDKTKVNELADSILESDGLLKPLVLKATGPESFEVIDGYLEYWAAVRAREKDPRKGEMVNAFVISPKDEEMIVKQLHALQSQAETSSSAPVIKSDEKAPAQKDVSTIILQPFKKELENIN